MRECVYNAASLPNGKWIIKGYDSNDVIGSVHKNTLDNGFSLTHSTLTSPRDFDNSIIEHGEVTNFVFMLKGKISLSCSGIKGWHPMSEGSAYAFQSSDSRISRKIKQNVNTEAVVIKICRHRLEDLMADTGYTLKIPLIGKITSAPLSSLSPMLCRKIIGCRYKGKTGCMVQLAGATDLIMDNFADESPNSDREKMTVLEVITYIKHHLNEELTLSSLAHIAGMSHTKLNKLFRGETGHSVFEFIRREKLKIAENHLRNTDMSITEIAYSAGFCSSSHFSESFRKEKGISPKLYRKTI